MLFVSGLVALVCCAIPNFVSPIPGLERTPQDLLHVSKCIRFFDEREPEPLSGESLKPLLGRYIQDPPIDFWGRELVYDASLGILASFGRDGVPGGARDNTDFVTSVYPGRKASKMTVGEALRDLYQARFGTEPPRLPSPKDRIQVAEQGGAVSVTAGSGWLH